MTKLHAVPVATILIIIFAIVGGIICVLNPHNWKLFEAYLVAIPVAAGALGIGRGLDQSSKP